MTRFAQMLLGSGIATVTALVGIAVLKPGPAPLDPARWATLEEPSVEVKFAGIQPREVRSYQPIAGTRSDLEVTLIQGGSASVAGQSLLDLEGEATLSVRTWIDAVEADGSIRYRWKVRGVDVGPHRVGGQLPADAWTRSVRDLKGLRGESLLDGQGYVLESSVSGGGPGSPAVNLGVEVRRMLQEPVPHLPDVAIGERAEWTVSRVVRNDGMPTTLLQRWKLMELDDDAWTLEVSLQGSGEPGDHGLGLPGFESSAVLAQTLEGEGAWTVGARSDLALDGSGWSRSEGGIDPGVTTELPGMASMVLRLETEADVTIRRAR